MEINGKLVAKVLGIVFVAVGILGFFPNPLVSSQGLFITNAAHNIVHLLTGIVFLAFSAMSNMKAVLFTKVFGVIYILVALLGFVLGGGAEEFHLLGFIHMNAIDNWLHLFLGVAILGVAFFIEKK